MPRGSQHVHYSQILTNVSVEFKQPGLVAEEIFPRFKVEHDTDLYYQFDLSSFNIVPDERADGAPENESTGGWIEKTYRVSYYGLRDKITDKTRKNSDGGLELEVSTTNRLTSQLRNGLEYRALGAGGVLRTAANNVYSANVDLTGVSASPRTKVTDAINAIQKASGMMPNIMVMNPEILRKITLTAEYREEFKYVTDIRNSDLPTQLYGLKVIQAGALGNLSSAGAVINKGQPASLNYIMEDDIWIGYVKPGKIGLRDLTYGVTFYTEQYSRKWRNEENETDWVAVDDNYVVQLIAKECGALLQSPFTA